jgi:uncharacterized protein (DUF58 family)
MGNGASISMPLTGGPARTAVRRRPRFDFSFTGLVYFLMMGLLGLAAINGQANLLFGVFGLMIGVLLVSGIICKLVLGKLAVTRIMPEYFLVGQRATILYQFKNKKRFWPSLSVTLWEQEGVEALEYQPTAYLLHTAARMTASVPVEVIPKRRGQYQLGKYQLSTSFPFGFVKRALEGRETDPMLVCPAIGRASRQILNLCRSDQREDAPIKPRAGGQDEFYGVKEHRAGENPRWIYWRRSARTPGVLVSKEMTQVAPPRLMLLADTYLQRDLPEEEAAVEKTLAMAATLASQCLDEGLAVGLCAWNGSDWIALPAQQGKRQRRDLLAALARLPRNTSADTEALLDASRGLTRTSMTAVLLTPRRMQWSLADRVRGALVVVPALSASADAWFSFDKEIDFSQCVPLSEAEDKPGAHKR